MKLPSDLSAFNLLTSRLDMLGQRQKSVAENVANANTPGYVPEDVDMTTFERSVSRYQNPSVGRVGLATTSSQHLKGSPPASPNVQTVAQPDSEVTMDGNAVVVEEQMLKLNQIRTDFDAAIGLYQKGLSMIHMAARKPQ